MSKTTVTVTKVQCDRCGTTENTGDMESRNEWGEMDVSWKGHTGGRAYDGAAGGVNHKGTAWLCLRCTNAFFSFMRGEASSPAAPVEGG